MLEKKKYVKPAVESEDAMEQTSLACTSTMFPMTDICDWGPTNLFSSAECETLPWKGGNFVADTFDCSVFPFAEACIVALS